jgi:hypothetical protein
MILTLFGRKKFTLFCAGVTGMHYEIIEYCCQASHGMAEKESAWAEGEGHCGGGGSNGPSCGLPLFGSKIPDSVAPMAALNIFLEAYGFTISPTHLPLGALMLVTLCRISHVPRLGFPGLRIGNEPMI